MRSLFPACDVEHEQRDDVQRQERRVELTVDEEFGTQEAPVDGPLEQELTPDVKRTHHVADRVDQQERQAEKQLKPAGVNVMFSIHGRT